MLRASARVVAAAVLAAGAVLVALPGVPAAWAAPKPGIPASAVNQLATEMKGAWQITDGRGVTVAVLDTLAVHVSDLAGKLTIGPNYAPLAGASRADGTVLASLIAGSGPTAADAFGAVGRAPGARILSEGVLNYTTSAREQQYQANGVWQGIVAKAIRYAVGHGASVIVDVESGPQDSATLDSAVNYALSKNVVVIGTSAAYGSSRTHLAYPDSLPGVINFSGTTIQGLPGPKGQNPYAVNSSVLVTAPDNQLDATGPGDQAYTAWGFDSAVAWVAGTAALIKSVYPQITPAAVARALAASASYHPAGGYNTKIGFGLVNPLGALHEAGSLLHLRTSAAPGAASLGAGARLATGNPPAAIHAVRHSVAKLAGYGAAIVFGGFLLLLAGRLRSRSRAPRRAHAGRHRSAGDTAASP